MTSHPRFIALAAGAVLFAVAALPGCALLEYLQDVPKPSITFKEANLDKLSWTDADMKLKFNLENPYPVAISVLSYDWDMQVSGKPFLGGKQAEKVAVNAQKASTIPVPFKLKFADLIARIAEAKSQGEVPFDVSGKITLETPVGPMNLPLKASGKLPVLQTPAVRMKTITAKLQGMTTLIVNVGLGLKQVNDYKLKLADLTYDLQLEGYKVAAGKATPGKAVPNSGETAVDIPIEINLISASSALVSSIMSGKFRYALSTDLGLDTPFGRAPLAFSDDGTLKLY